MGPLHAASSPSPAIPVRTARARARRPGMAGRLLLGRGGDGGRRSGRRRGRGSGGAAGGHDAHRPLVGHHRQGERGQHEHDRHHRGGLAEYRRRAHRSEHRLAAGAAEGGADVGPLAGLQQDQADDGHAHDHVEDHDQDEHDALYSFEAPLRAADFLAMVMKPAAWRLAPPTSTPSMSGSWVSAWALSALTLPPYRMRIDWASSLEATSETRPRR